MAASAVTNPVLLEEELEEEEDTGVGGRRHFLAEKMKALEAELGVPTIDTERYWIVRLDGHGFSTFTRGFEKPCDFRIHKAMALTAADLLSQFQPTAVYTESDEISLIFPSRLHYLNKALARASSPDSSTTSASSSSCSNSAADVPTEGDEATRKHDLVHASAEEKKRRRVQASQDSIASLQHSADTFSPPYNGKLQKVVSLMAGYTSARFNWHLGAALKDTIAESGHPDDAPREGSRASMTATLETKGGQAWFDARVFHLNDEEDVFNNILWRSFDAQRNSKSMLGCAHFSAKQLHKLTSQQIIEKVKAEKDIDYYALPSWFRGGVLIKRRRVIKDTHDPRSGQLLQVQRRVHSIADWLRVKRFGSDLLLAKNADEIAGADALFTNIDQL